MLATQGHVLGNYHPLLHFLMNEINEETFDDEALDLFLALDDIDIMASVKQWQFHTDPILSTLCKRLLYRKLPKVFISNMETSPNLVAEATEKAMQKFNVSETEALNYFVKTGILENHAYKTEGGGIRILRKNGSVSDVAESSDNYNLAALKETVKKYYLIHWGK
jgi:hypothetical protein